MATQKDLDKLRKQLSDLDAKLKSMRGNQKAPVARPPNFVDRGRDVPRTPIDMVRDPRFDSAMANQNFLNSLAELRAKAAAERGTPTPPSGPLGGPVGSARSKRDPSKEIVLNFAGGEYGIRNDAAANAIAKKYNLEIVRNPDPNSALPNYIFKSNGNVNDIISQIKNEPGIGYAEQNSMQYGGPAREPKAPTQPRLSGQDPRDQNTRYKGPEAPTQPRLSPSSISPSSILNPETLTKAREEYVKQNPGEVNRQVKADLVNSRYLGQIGRGMSGFDKWFEKNYINNPNSSLSEQERMALNPQRGQRPPQGPQAPMIGYASQQPGNMPLPNIPQGPQVGGGEGLNYKGQQFDASEQPGYGDPYFQGSKRYQEREDYQNFLKQGGQRPPERPQVGGGMGELVPQRPNLIPQPGIRIPQGPQNAQDAMSAYNNLLQQGIQRSNTLNQDAASNFANMQAGAPIPQPAAPAKANPTMPIAGMGMQQPKATPVPRKFSTVNTPSARFG